jgi:mRNA interferase MazF
MRIQQGDVVLIPVPFTDLSSRKRRPVIVVSSEAYHASGKDMIVVAMTSNPAQALWSFRIESSDLITGQLNRPGTVRVDRIYTLAQSLAVARFGAVSRDVLDRIRATLADVVRSAT